MQTASPRKSAVNRTDIHLCKVQMQKANSLRTPNTKPAAAAQVESVPNCEGSINDRYVGGAWWSALAKPAAVLSLLSHTVAKVDLAALNRLRTNWVFFVFVGLQGNGPSSVSQVFNKQSITSVRINPTQLSRSEV